MGMSIQEQSREQSRRPSAYGPMNLNPLRLANATIQAVDQLGAATSEEIEKTADEIMRGATEVAAKLRELADAIREHTEIANAQVESFCSKATSVFERIVELQDKLRANEEALQAAQAGKAEDEALPLPAFIKKGPAEASEL
jgi:uncharacterized coiled-coil DUF342 family protein